MTLNFYPAESTVMPMTVDTISSSSNVYIRTDIVEDSYDNSDGTKTTMYKYQEAVLTKEEYAIYLAEQNRADIDYISLIADIDLA